MAIRFKYYLEVLCHFSHLSIHLIDELLDGLDTLLTTTLRTDSDSTISGFLLADDDHIGDALQLIVANLTAQFLVAQVDGSTYPTLAELLADLLGIVVIFL